MTRIAGLSLVKEAIEESRSESDSDSDFDIYAEKKKRNKFFHRQKLKVKT
jgi:hypothetical protein